MKFGHTIRPLFCHIHGDINMWHFCKYFSCDNPNKKDNFHQLMVMALQNIISIKLVTWFRIWIRIFLVHSSFFTVMLALSAGNGITLGAVNSRWRMRVDRWRHDTCPWRRTNTQHSAPSSVLSAVIAVIMTALDVLTRQSLQLRQLMAAASWRSSKDVYALEPQWRHYINHHHHHADQQQLLQQ